jgi:hypothetical protein
MRVLGLILLILSLCYYWHSRKKPVVPQAPVIESRPIPSIHHPKDWSEMVAAWMQTCHQFNLKLLKIDPKNGLDFSLYLQGQYLDFLKWVQLTALKLPSVHWQKIIIYHHAKQTLNIQLHGAYYEIN